MTTSDNTYDARTGILLVDQLSPAAEAKLKRLARLTGKPIKEIRADALKKGVDDAYLRQFFGPKPVSKLIH